MNTAPLRCIGSPQGHKHSSQHQHRSFCVRILSNATQARRMTSDDPAAGTNRNGTIRHAVAVPASMPGCGSGSGSERQGSRVVRR
jgi:hypothetical protein